MNDHFHEPGGNGPEYPLPDADQKLLNILAAIIAAFGFLVLLQALYK
jgi:hypothetical protein